MIPSLKLWLAGTGLVAVVAAGLWLHHSGFKAGERAVRAEWQAAIDKGEADNAAREADLRRQALTLSLDLQKQRDTAGKLQQELEHERSKGTIVVEVPGKCPELGPGFIRVWNDAARGTPASPTSPAGSAGTVPGTGADTAH